MNGECDFGFITMAFGSDKYFVQAEHLARSLRRHMPNFKIAIISDREDVGSLFDKNIPFKVQGKPGTILKTELYQYSPFKETLFIDTDCIVARPFYEELKEIRAFEFSPVVSKFLQRGDHDLWIKDVGFALEALNGTPFPKFNGGVYFFRKGEHSRSVFKISRDLIQRSAELGLLDFDAAGPGEETLIGMALSCLKVTSLYNDGGRLMKTPLNSTGPIHLDVIGGSCSFQKGGRIVRPAICHFCGEWVDHPTYLIAQAELIRGRKISSAMKYVIHARYTGSRLIDKVRRKLLKAMGLIKISQYNRQ